MEDRLKEALQVFGQEYIDAIDDILRKEDKIATGDLIKSLKPRVIKTGFGTSYTLKVIAEDYWDRLNQGVNGTAKSWGSPYSFDSMGLTDEFRNRIKTWTRDRGITPKEPEMSQDDLAYVIAKSVRKKGVMPVPFMDEGFSPEAIKDLANRLGKTVKRIFE